MRTAGRKVDCWLSDIKNAGNSQVEKKSSFFHFPSPPFLFLSLSLWRQITAAASSYIPHHYQFFFICFLLDRVSHSALLPSSSPLFTIPILSSLTPLPSRIHTCKHTWRERYLIEEVYFCDSISPKKKNKKQQAIVAIAREQQSEGGRWTWKKKYKNFYSMLSLSGSPIPF